MTNRKQCYIIQSSTRDKRNKINKKHNLKNKNGGSKNEKVVKCRIKQRGKRSIQSALKANKIKYEASNCGYGLTHFEVFVNTSEIDILEGVLSTL